MCNWVGIGDDNWQLGSGGGSKIEDIEDLLKAFQTGPFAIDRDRAARGHAHGRRHWLPVFLSATERCGQVSMDSWLSGDFCSVGILIFGCRI